MRSNVCCKLVEASLFISDTTSLDVFNFHATIPLDRMVLNHRQPTSPEKIVKTCLIFNNSYQQSPDSEEDAGERKSAQQMTETRPVLTCDPYPSVYRHAVRVYPR